MNYFQTGRSHILVVSTSPGQSEGALGIVTLEDIVEVGVQATASGHLAVASGSCKYPSHADPRNSWAERSL